MASQWYKVLTNIENGRKACVEELKKAGVEINDNASLNSVATSIPYIREGVKNPNRWERPADWPNSEEIFATVQEPSGYKKSVFMLLDNTDETQSINITAPIDGILTSDGSWYTSTTTHTWDKTKDLGQYRYLILFYKEDKAAQDRAFSYIYTTYPSLVEMLVYHIHNSKRTTSNAISAGASAVNTVTYSCVRSIKIYEEQEFFYWGSGTFNGLQFLENLEILCDLAIASSNVNIGWSGGYCYPYINMPKMNKFTSSTIFTYCSSLTTASECAWEFTYSNGAYSVPWAQKTPYVIVDAKSIFPQIKIEGKMNLSKRCDLPNLVNIQQDFGIYYFDIASLPALNTIESGASLSFYDIKEINCVNLETGDIKIFPSQRVLEKISLPNFKGNIYYGHSSKRQPKKSILNFFNSLPKIDTVIENSGICYLYSRDLNNLTEEEKAIATNKGWKLTTQS